MKMRILVAIANYGTKNIKYLDRLISEYKTMSHEVHMVILSNVPKELGNDIEVIVGLPIKDPWSLPFGHKKLFAERINNYDLFIYSEDDTLITQRNIDAFLRVSDVLPHDKIAGFIRYEVDTAGNRYYSTVHGSYHWIHDSMIAVGGYTFAQFTNEHSACFMLTREQLQRAIDSGGFIVPPHKGRHDMLCSAATDPYTQCGYTKYICVSHIEDFILHHLPNQYIGKMGISVDDFSRQIEALQEIAKGIRKPLQLFNTEKTVNTSKWNKDYYEPIKDDVLAQIDDDTASVLSVGCGFGKTEGKLIERGIRVIGVPLDSVISINAEDKGIELTEADFDIALSRLRGTCFKYILFINVLHHLADPVDTIKEISELLSTDGKIIISVPNFNHIRFQRELKEQNISFNGDCYANTGFHFTTSKMVGKWLKRAGYSLVAKRYMLEDSYKNYESISFGYMNELLASNITYVAEKV